MLSHLVHGHVVCVFVAAARPQREGVPEEPPPAVATDEPPREKTEEEKAIGT